MLYESEPHYERAVFFDRGETFVDFPPLMDTPKSAKVRATGVNSGEGTEAEAADVFSGVQS